MRHGHVTPNPDGSKARCGGPAICPECQHELMTMIRDRPDSIPALSPLKKQDIIRQTIVDAEAVYRKVMDLADHVSRKDWSDDVSNATELFGVALRALEHIGAMAKELG